MYYCQFVYLPATITKITEICVMPKTLHLILFPALLLSACVTTSPTHEPNELQIQFDAVNSKLEKLETSLASQVVKSCEQDNSDLEESIATAVVNKLRKPKKKKTKVKVVTCASDGKKTSIDGKLIFGSVEYVELVKEELKIKARIDTGAMSSSIGVYRVQKFERDGKRWVRFALDKADDARVYEYPVSGTINIKQESDEVAEYRFEIKADVLVGGKKYRNQVFNLADRSHLDYQLLIGRNFLKDIAVVDVSGRYLLGKK